MFEKNRAMKIFGYIFIAFWAVYMFCFGVSFYFIFEGGSVEAFDMVNGGFVVFLAMDFFIRFGMQDTPAQDIKPYKLLPIPQKFLLNVFLVRMGLRLYNLFWFCFFVPFGVLAVCRFYGFSGLVGYLLGVWLMFVVNSYFYLIFRTLINRNILYSAIPLLWFAAMIFLGLVSCDFTKELFGDNVQPLFHASAELFRQFITWNPCGILTAAVMIVPLFAINHYMQFRAIYTEIAREEEVSTYKSSQMKWLDRFGVIGEYLKLEVKSTMRNAVVRKQFVTGVVFMVMFCSAFAFTDIYDNDFMRIYICTYCFACLGVMTLTMVMCPEGNYIDGLMSRKESVLSLLKAKYYFNFILLLVPFLFALMPVMKGKLTMVDVWGCLFFTSGCVFPFLFQLAAYNNNSINLNAKLTKNSGSTKTQMLFSLAALFVPMTVMYTLMIAFSEDVAAWCLLLIGLTGTLLHPVWLRDVYKRFMKRRYQNMDGFRNSR